MIKFFKDRNRSEDRINWVDSNNVFLGFENQGQCCSDTGFIYLDSLNEDKKPIDIEFTDNNNFFFDPNFYLPYKKEDFNLKKIIKSIDPNFDKNIERGEWYDFYGAIFKIINGSKEIYLLIYAYQNGYYAHGFKFCNNQTVLVEDSV